MIDRSERPQPPTVPLLNVDAIPYQPLQTTSTPVTLEEHQEPDVNHSAILPAGPMFEDTPMEHENTQEPSLTNSPHIPTNVTPQFTTRLPKLTLPHIFWKSTDMAELLETPFLLQ